MMRVFRKNFWDSGLALNSSGGLRASLELIDPIAIPRYQYSRLSSCRLF